MDVTHNESTQEKAEYKIGIERPKHYEKVGKRKNE